MVEFSTEFWVGMAFAAIALLVGLAVAIVMVESTKGEFRFVVFCFLSSAVLVFYGIGVWEMSVTWPTRPRIIVGTLAFALVAMLTTEIVRWAHGRHLRASVTRPSDAPPTGSTGSTQPKEEINEPKIETPTTERPKTVEAYPKAAKPPIKEATKAVATIPQPPAKVIPKDRTGRWMLKIDDIPPEDINLLDLFDHDFPSATSKIGGGWTLQPKETSQPSMHVYYYVMLEFGSSSKFVSFYVPSSTDAYNVCASLADYTPQALDEAGRFGVTGKEQSGDSTLNTAKEAVFTGRVYIYSQADLAVDDLAKLTDLYRSKNLKLQFRSNDYLENQQLKLRIKRQ
jgi:hypothetical protein